MSFLMNFFNLKERAKRNPDRGDFRNETATNYQKKIENEIVNLEKEKVGVEIIVEFDKRKEKYPENTENAFENRWKLLEEIKAKYEMINQVV